MDMHLAKLYNFNFVIIRESLPDIFKIRLGLLCVPWTKIPAAPLLFYKKSMQKYYFSTEGIQTRYAILFICMFSQLRCSQVGQNSHFLAYKLHLKPKNLEANFLKVSFCIFSPPLKMAGISSIISKHDYHALGNAIAYFFSHSKSAIKFQFSCKDLRKTTEATEYYKRALQSDALCTEALATIAMNHFYNSQPEVALHFYKRLLEMGLLSLNFAFFEFYVLARFLHPSTFKPLYLYMYVHGGRAPSCPYPHDALCPGLHQSAELYTNVAVCCYYAQQFAQCLQCFERALSLAETDALRADIWFNIGLISIVSTYLFHFFLFPIHINIKSLLYLFVQLIMILLFSKNKREKWASREVRGLCEGSKSWKVIPEVYTAQ